MARKTRPTTDAGTWMNTYSDLVTLLLTFFVLLFSMSSPNAERWEQFTSALAGVEIDPTEVLAQQLDQSEETQWDKPQDEEDQTLPEEFDQLYEYLKEHIRRNNMEASVEVTKAESVVYVRFQSNVFFNPDEAVLKSESKPVLDFLGDCLESVQDEILMISINGHTAAIPGVEDYQVSDWTLSGERATSIAIYFEEDKGLDPRKLRPAGFGKNYPVASNDTPQGREKNRRVDMVIVSNRLKAASDDPLYQALSGLFDPLRFPQEGGAQDLMTPEDTQGDTQDLS